MSTAARTAKHAPPAGQDVTGFGLGRPAYDNATTARSRRLVALSARAEDVATSYAQRLHGYTVLAGLQSPTAAADASRCRARRDHFRRRAHVLWSAALAADSVLAWRYR